MSLLPIIYTSVLIFCGLVITVVVVSYTIYKVKGGGPKPAAIQVNKPIHYPQHRAVNTNKVYAANNRNLNNSYKPGRSQEELMFYKKPVNAQRSNTVKISAAPRIQVLNKPVEKKIVVVRKSANYNSYDENNFLGYYNEKEKGVLIRA